MSSNRSSRDYSSKRKPLVRSLRAKSSSSTGSSSHRKKEAHSIVLLDADQLDDEREAKEGLTPITLTRWILSQAWIGEKQYKSSCSRVCFDFLIHYFDEFFGF